MAAEFGRDVRLKQYVDIEVLHTKEGKARPMKIIMENGCSYEIDKIHEVKRLASTKVGGMGMCYMVSINGHKTRIFDEENGQWFVEAKAE